uniref:hypothetical protein n=1 Tax=Pseudomaricurvus sp. TaxID=2004510 RepID=UPI003F6BC875
MSAAFRLLTTSLMVTTLYSLGITQQAFALSPSHVYPDIEALNSSASAYNKMTWDEFKVYAAQGALSGTYLFSEGTYDISEKVDLPTQSGRVTLKGAEGALFKGDFSREDPLTIEGGFSLATSYFTFKDMVFSDVGNCIYVDRGARSNNVVIENLTSHNTHTCILIDRNKSLNIDNWQINNVSINDYFRTGIRISGPNTKNIFLSNFVIDGQREGWSHCYKGAIQILESANYIKIRDG